MEIEVRFVRVVLDTGEVEVLVTKLIDVDFIIFNKRIRYT